MSKVDSFINKYKLENKTVAELLKISIAIDVIRNNGFLYQKNDILATIAEEIWCLMDNEDTKDDGMEIYNAINDLILQKNEKQMQDKKHLSNAIHDERGTYRVIKTNTGYRFVLVADNGELLASSEIYSHLDSCTIGIESVKKHLDSQTADLTIEATEISNPKFELYVDRVGEYRFRLKARNGAIILTSEGYKTKVACLNAIQRTKKAGKSDYVEKY